MLDNWDSLGVYKHIPRLVESLLARYNGISAEVRTEIILHVLTELYIRGNSTPTDDTIMELIGLAFKDQNAVASQYTVSLDNSGSDNENGSYESIPDLNAIDPDSLEIFKNPDIDPNLKLGNLTVLNDYETTLLLTKPQQQALAQYKGILAQLGSTEEVLRVLIGNREYRNFLEMLDRISLRIADYIEFKDAKLNNISASASSWSIYTDQTLPYFYIAERRALRYSFEANTEQWVLRFIFNTIINIVKEADDDLFSKRQKMAFVLSLQKNLTNADVAILFGIRADTVSTWFSHIRNYIKSLDLDTENLILNFLQLTPIEMFVYTHSMNGFTPAEIAKEIDISEDYVYKIIASTRKKLAFRFDGAANAKDFKVSANIAEIEFNGKTIGINSIQSLNTPTEEQLRSYISSNGMYQNFLLSLYREANPQVVKENHELIKLYFLLREIPDVGLISQLIGESEGRVQAKIGELRSALGIKVKPHVADDLSWVEKLDSARFFLLDAVDIQILDSIVSRIEEISKDYTYGSDESFNDFEVELVDRITAGKVTKEIQLDTLKRRLIKIQETFGIDPRIPIVYYPYLVRRDNSDIFDRSDIIEFTANSPTVPSYFMSITEVFKELGISADKSKENMRLFERRVRQIAGDKTDSNGNPLYIDTSRNRIEKGRAYCSPELLVLLRINLPQKQRAPSNWITVSELYTILNGKGLIDELREFAGFKKGEKIAASLQSLIESEVFKGASVQDLTGEYANASGAVYTYYNYDFVKVAIRNRYNIELPNLNTRES